MHITPKPELPVPDSCGDRGTVATPGVEPVRP